MGGEEVKGVKGLVRSLTSTEGSIHALGNSLV